MEKVREVLAEAYNDAIHAGIGDDGGSEPTYATNAVDIILDALNEAGFKVVPHQQGVSSYEPHSNYNAN